jgi:hypothetical protein
MSRNYGLGSKPDTFHWRRYRVTSYLCGSKRFWTLAGARRYLAGAGGGSRLYEWGGHGWFERM